MIQRGKGRHGTQRAQPPVKPWPIPDFAIAILHHQRINAACGGIIRRGMAFMPAFRMQRALQVSAAFHQRLQRIKARCVGFKRDAFLGKNRKRRFQCGFGCRKAAINADLDQDFHNGARRQAKLQRSRDMAAQLRLVLHGTEHRQRHRHAFLAGQAGAFPDIAIDKFGHQIAKAKGAIGQGSIARAENLSA